MRWGAWCALVKGTAGQRLFPANITLVSLLLEAIDWLRLSPCLQTHPVLGEELTCAHPQACAAELGALAGCSAQMAACNHLTSLPRLREEQMLRCARALADLRP